MDNENATSASGLFDDIVLRLTARRAEAGSPSYAEIAGRVKDLRVARGAPEHEARIARSTVYDLFRLGRKRLDVDLLLDVVAALGGDQAEVAQWRAECCQATQAPAPPSTVELPPLGPGKGVLRPLTGWEGTGLILLGLGINWLGIALNDVFPLDLYLDMIGTAIVAIVLGPWRGAAVGLATNVLIATQYSHTWNSAWFGLCSVAGALVWGYGVRRGLGRTIPRFALLNVLVAVTVSVIASVIIMTVYDGYTGHGSDDLVHSLVDQGGVLWTSVVSANLVNSLCDKMLAGFVALFAAEAIRARQRGGGSTELLLGADPTPDH